MWNQREDVGGYTQRGEICGGKYIQLIRPKYITKKHLKYQYSQYLALDLGSNSLINSSKSITPLQFLSNLDMSDLASFTLMEKSYS